MPFETIILETNAHGIATLTLNRPDKHNALSARMIAELSEAAQQLAADDAVRAVILTGAGKSFCAGGDLNWMREQFEADRSRRMAEARKLADMLKALDDLPKPLIGRINGQAYGGGLGMIAVCDIAFASETATFGFTETRLGLIPATIAPYVVGRIGQARIREVFMSPRIFGSGTAKRLGLLAHVVEPDHLDAAVSEEAELYLKAAPQAVAEAKALAKAMGSPVTEEAIVTTVAWLADMWDQPEAQDRIARFLDKQR
ncbi:crotonase/enoyl-CoA hydratase family protein [Cucumibacter marinus]|uniref:crotonase/enoyl-CoA hydratase family protein n=1 Tax=Cucumibacter marinus TaxID=1121252 RepID=UPI00040B078E|nr:crotonase/enoyl-CoA hydratase family protein [Cucumibacter marinus]